MDATWVGEQAAWFGLVLARLAGLSATAPVLGGAAVPAPVRGALALVLALVVLPVVPAPAAGGPVPGWAYGVALAAEALLGLAIGLLAQLLLLAAQGAGELLDLELGFHVAQIFDPGFVPAGSLTGAWLHLVALLALLAVDGHLLLLRAVLESFRAIPPGAVALGPEAWASAASLLGWVLLTAVRLALPVLAALALVTVALAVAGRMLPQLNVLITGIPVKIGAGLATLMLVTPLLVPALGRLAVEALGLLAAWLAEVRP